MIFALISIAQIGAAHANCVNTTRGVSITGGTTAEGQPTAGETVVCDASPPNPFTFGIIAPTAQSGISVTLQSGAIINAPGSGVLLDDQATIVNDGTVNTTTVNGFGLSKQFQGSITNNGTVTTSGASAHGLRSLGGFGLVTNNGTVTVSGANASGIFTSVSETIANSGSITASGTGGNGVFMLGGSSFTNTATGLVVSDLGTGVLGSGSNFTVRTAGTIVGGNGTAINLLGGTNLIEVTGGQITGDVLTGAGVDTFNWLNAGTIAGVVNLGAGDDIATLAGLTNANLAATSALDGGLGTDGLTFNNVVIASPTPNLLNWETIALTNGTQFTMAGDLTLGDSGTGTGTLSIDSSSTLFAGAGVNPSVSPFDGVTPVTLTNAGLIDLTNGGTGPTDSLTIVGNYVGQGGRIRLDTFLGADGSPSDRLVISGGNASGSTSLQILNAGGAGALTTANGILVVDAINGGSTAPGAFALAGRVVGGPFEYTLHRSSVDSSNAQAWFLRSTLDCDLPGAPSPPCPAPTTPSPEPAPPVPNFRAETSFYAAIPALALL